MPKYPCGHSPAIQNITLRPPAKKHAVRLSEETWRIIERTVPMTCYKGGELSNKREQARRIECVIRQAFLGIARYWAEEGNGCLIMWPLSFDVRVKSEKEMAKGGAL